MKTELQENSRINDLFLLYKAYVQLTAMKPLTKKIYIAHAENLVRWVSGDFVPGGKLKITQLTEIDF